MGAMISRAIAAPVVAIFTVIFVSLLDAFLVFMWVTFAAILLLLALLAWLAGFTTIAMVMVSLVLALTINIYGFSRKIFHLPAYKRIL